MDALLELSAALKFFAPMLELAGSAMSYFPVLALPFVLLYALWFFYLAIMNLKRAKESGGMTKVALFLAAPMALVGYVLDVFVNVTIGTLLFLDLPHYKRPTLSERMSYWYDPKSTSWRSKLAGYLAKNLLDPYDPSGQHIE